jgi:ABC-2 type transport system ATP-binding protein
VAPALRIADLHKHFGAHAALKGVSLEIAPGQLLGLLGPNGAGKSTLTKIACGLVHPDAGVVEVAGHPAGSRPARTAVGYLAELFRFPGFLSAREVLGLHQRLTGSAGGAGERDDLLRLVGLADAADRRVATMSKGMQQRLGIAQALVGAPEVLLLDEPTSALDPAGRATVRELLTEVRGRGIAVLLNSHLLGEVERVCDRVAIIVGGEVVAAGTADELGGRSTIEVELASGVQRFDGDREDVPRILERFVRHGEPVFGARVVRSSLEDAYLEAVAGAEEARRAG